MCALFLISPFSTRHGCVRTEESDCYVPDVNGLGQNKEWHVRNFWPIKI